VRFRWSIRVGALKERPEERPERNREDRYRDKDRDYGQRGTPEGSPPEHHPNPKDGAGVHKTNDVQ